MILDCGLSRSCGLFDRDEPAGIEERWTNRADPSRTGWATEGGRPRGRPAALGAYFGKLVVLAGAKLQKRRHPPASGRGGRRPQRLQQLLRWDRAGASSPSSRTGGPLEAPVVTITARKAYGPGPAENRLEARRRPGRGGGGAAGAGVPRRWFARRAWSRIAGEGRTPEFAAMVAEECGGCSTPSRTTPSARWPSAGWKATPTTRSPTSSAAPAGPWRAGST